VTAAELWTRVDIGAGMMVGVVAPLVSVAAMLTFRPPASAGASEPRHP
jgi:hypothetical protein